MQDVVLGRLLRALRRRRGWRQVDLAARSGVSQSHVSSVERGHLDTSTLRVLRRLFGAVEARLELVATWRGAQIERLLDEDHATIVVAVAHRLEEAGWQVELEVTYSEFGERGSIDILALHPAARACLVVEVKTDIPSSESVGRKVDEKARLAPGIVERRFGWRPDSVGRVVVLPESMRLRRLADRGGLRRMFPASAAALRAWLRRPIGGIRALWFISVISPRGVRGSRGVRIRATEPSARTARARTSAATGPDRAPAPSKSSGSAI